MKKIIAYLGIIAVIDILVLFVTRLELMPLRLKALGLILQCAVIGGIGGVVYCLRAVYLNACIRKSWSDEWQAWYYIRPVVSHFCGAVSYLFLKAGLIFLESKQEAESTSLGFLALAFIAGLNVDKFISKIEDVAQATWGIEKSRMSKEDE